MRNTSTKPQTIFIYRYSLGGSSFEQLMRLDTTIVSLIFQQKKKKKEEEEERKRRHT